jgi:hypothetical protein
MRLDTPINIADLPVATGDYSLIPDGWYTAHVKSAVIQNTKSGSGEYIKVRFDIVGPTHAGRVVFANLNIKNQNPKAEEIGRAQLGQLALAIGLTGKVADTDQLVGGTISIKIATRKQEGYDDSNEVKGYKSLNGSLPTVNVAKSDTAPAKAVDDENTPPWMRKKQAEDQAPAF